MLSKRSLALTSICYNLCAILATLLVDIIAPGPFASWSKIAFRNHHFVYKITFV